MVSGFDRYFQIAPCFRDEDPRADRSPGEFYQLDMEMSFATQEDVFQVMEPIMRGIFEEFGGGRPVTPEFPRIPYREAMKLYASDKPDLRNPIKMEIVSEHFAGSGFKIFAKMLEEPGTEVRAIPAPTGGSRKFCDRMDSFAKREGLPGNGYIFWREEEGATVGAGPLAKNIGPERAEAIRQQLGLQVGDAAFFLGGRPSQFEAVAGKARNVIGEELGLTEKDVFKFAWIVDFPMYERDEETGALDFSHNPVLDAPGRDGGAGPGPARDPRLPIRHRLHGIELSSGAVRNHKPEIMYRAFEIVGHDKAFVDENFGGMINAFTYGAPPHAGIAPGIDRMVMLLADAENIREVILFPLNQRAEDLMLGAPSEPTSAQLTDLGLRRHSEGLTPGPYRGGSVTPSGQM